MRQILAQPTCIVGVGNPLRNDDAVGALIAERLAPVMSAAGRHTVINAEDVIENYCFSIADSAVRNVLVIDAIVGGGAEPGSVVLGRLEDLEAADGGYSTHKLALAATGGVLRHHGKDVWLLGIAAANTDYGTAVSQDVMAAAEAVIDLIRRTYPRDTAGYPRDTAGYPRDTAPAVSRQCLALRAPRSAVITADRVGAHSKEF
ncbi:MAG: hydrogenase maturation protease [Lamprocystis purpurea]|uniref:hydrogenase maturation protease n=1 Tax=Lamprocystis purpurea TaxID=61598 RepID=UPI001B7FA238|nr:hydrogenase maturation protease [Lamprocystis purpurea]MBV5274885.1 hydrogenase maturation protease [Lamprocystis purpurea]